jgi:hypothetical protein
MKPREMCCAICGEERTSADGWFMLTENQWTDRLKILGWNDVLAAHPSVYLACGSAHVQQLVVHWMTMGSLEYPFAIVAPERKTPAGKTTAARSANVEARGVKVIGELAVHRESLARILRENPESLAGVLEALVGALGGRPKVERSELVEDEEEAEIYALT